MSLKNIYLLILTITSLIMSGCVYYTEPKEYRINPPVASVHYYPTTITTPPRYPLKPNICRLTCFSYDPYGVLYPLDDTSQGRPIYVKGYIHVPGELDYYQVCRPANYGMSDISNSEEFRTLCRLNIPSCGYGCWAGGQQ